MGETLAELDLGYAEERMEEDRADDEDRWTDERADMEYDERRLEELREERARGQ